jgi:GntR family transcriptional repressor for pyruvate dehydrogenase complex
MVDAGKSGTPRRERLSHPLIEALQEKIFSGALSPGDQLPTEQQLVSEFGVSRTVVREAISGLRANGLVDARQGRGVFVTDRKVRFDLSVLSGDLGELGTILELLELRLPIEIEAAGLAAMRRSPAQEARIRLAFNRLGQSIDQGESAVGADFDLHIAIVEATNNHFYVDVLKFLGQ